MIIAWDNLADDASISTDSEIATLPASNVQQEHVVQKWHTVAGVTSAYLIFDMGASVTADVLAVLGANLSAAGTVRVRASDSDSTVTSSTLLDTGALASGIVGDFASIYKQFASTTARYWRLDFDDSSLEDNIQIGRVFIGPSWEPTYNMMLGVAYIDDDPSIVSRSRAGQRFVEELPHQRGIMFELDFLSESEMMDNAFAMARANGIARDVLVIPDIASSYLAQKSVFGPCVASTPVVNDKLYLYRQKFTVEERL